MCPSPQESRARPPTSHATHRALTCHAQSRDLCQALNLVASTVSDHVTGRCTERHVAARSIDHVTVESGEIARDLDHVTGMRTAP